MKNRWLYALISLLLLLPLLVQGQLVEYGIANINKKNKLKALRTHQQPLQLPFWDDFYASDGVPDDSLWDNSDNVLINNHYAIRPPSLGVATFDGLRFDGSPYNTDPESSESTDRLTSHTLDLSQYTAADNLVLSFFYQLGGNGETPDYDNGDKLQVEFKDADGNWQQALVILPEVDRNPEEFTQVLLKIEDPALFHEDFQFALQSFGNQSGPFDLWHVDYIYLNSNRSLGDIYYPDRAINQDLSNIFADYSAIPRTHINLEEDLQMPFYLLNNLYNDFQTYEQSATITVTKTDGISTAKYPFTKEGTGSPIFKDETDVVTVPFPITENGLPEPDSSVQEIEYEVIIKAFDNQIDSGNYDPKYAPIDFRVNDTLRKSFEIKDYYAYDDGTAEAAAGLQMTGNKLAYQFVLKHVDSAYIHGMDINTVYAGATANGKSIDVHIWENNGEVPGELLIKKSITISGNDLRDSFTRYSIRTPVMVKDTFFIGFTLTSSGKLPIGLDKNSDNTSKIFENVSGEWLPIGDRISGTLMMRPFVGPEPSGPVTSIEDDIIPEEPAFALYPNPSNDGRFYLQGNVKEIQAINVAGQEISYEFERSNGKESQLFIPQKGVFILKILIDHQFVYRKVIVN